MAKIDSWNPGKGFGFVDVDGQRRFIHISSIFPQPRRGENLQGRELMHFGVGSDGKIAVAILAETDMTSLSIAQAEREWLSGEGEDRFGEKVVEILKRKGFTGLSFARETTGSRVRGKFPDGSEVVVAVPRWDGRHHSGASLLKVSGETVTTVVIEIPLLLRENARVRISRMENGNPVNLKNGGKFPNPLPKDYVEAFQPGVWLEAVLKGEEK